MTKKNLDICNLSQEKSEHRDYLIQELDKNNSQIKAPVEHFWNVVRNILKQQLPIINYFEHSPEWRREISENTDYMLLRDDEQRSSPVNINFNPFPIPDNMKHFENLLTNDRYFMDLANYCYLKNKTATKVASLQQRNPVILTKLCAIDLEARVGLNFRGIYAYAGLDIDLPYQLGGEWLIIEPNWPYGDYAESIRGETNFGRQGILEGRIKTSTSQILEDEIYFRIGNQSFEKNKGRRAPINNRNLDPKIAEYTPEVALIKIPTPQAEYKEVLSFYKTLLHEDTLLISDTILDDKSLSPIFNLVGKKGLEELRSHAPSRGLGGPICQFNKFRMYIFKPKTN